MSLREFFSSKRFKIIVAVLALITGVILYSASTGGLATLPEQAVSYILIPLQKASAAVSNAVSDFFSPFINAKKNENKNIQLTEALHQLQQQLVDYEETKTENERLREILDLKDLNPDIEFIDAGIIARDANDAFGSFTIDVGTVHGISRYDPVVTGAGLVGYVDMVGPTYAKVVTVLSPEINVGAFEIESKETGNITGTVALAAKGRTKLELIPKDNEIAIGDIIVTAGSSGLYPKNIVIGTVEELSLEESGITMYAVIKPVNEIDQMKHVYVLTDFLGKDTGYEE